MLAGEKAFIRKLLEMQADCLDVIGALVEGGAKPHKIVSIKAFAIEINSMLIEMLENNDG